MVVKVNDVVRVIMLVCGSGYGYKKGNGSDSS